MFCLYLMQGPRFKRKILFNFLNTDLLKWNLQDDDLG